MLSTLLAHAQSPILGFNGPMNRDTLENQLRRAVTMGEMVNMTWCPWATCDTPTSTPAGKFNPTAAAEVITMAVNTRARFLGRVAGLWMSEWTLYGGYPAAAAKVVTDINTAYDNAQLQRPIMQAGVFEIATTDVNYIEIPSRVVNVFKAEYDAMYPGTPLIVRLFRLSDMMYNTSMYGPGGTVNASTQIYWDGTTTRIVPDMSRLETQMWFYYLATEHIKIGYEAIHFGQINLMDDADPGHRGWWNMLTKVRAYAATNAQRGIVLCDAHVGPDPYYDPNPAAPLTGTSRQLLFDFHSFPIRMQQDLSKAWSPGGGGATLKKELSPGEYCGAPYGKNMGGKTFFQWTTTGMPYLVEFDNFSLGSPGTCNPWGYDEIAWYYAQSTNYRNQWLKYAYYKAKCLDPNAFVQFVASRGVTGQGATIYRATNGPASAGNGNQQNMIKRVWAGEYKKDWFHYSTGLNNAAATSNPVFIGNNMYYIGPDQRVYGAISTGPNPNQWTQVSVFLQSGGAYSSQVLAAGDLVYMASPEGPRLLYRGTDGKIYGYNVPTTSPATNSYGYFALSSGALAYDEQVKSDLIVVGNDLYYRSNSNRLYGYVRNGSSWVTTSPSWTANYPGIPGKNQTSINNQALVAGSVVANSTGTKLYYRGTDNLVHGFYSSQQWSYEYFDLPFSVAQGNLYSDEQVGGSLVCTKADLPNSDRLFYIGQDGRVFGFLQNASYGAWSPQTSGGIPYGGFWGKISPSYSAQLTPNGLHEQRIAFGLLVASPDGKTLVYRGNTNSLHGFRILDDYNSEYFDMTALSGYDVVGGHLRFKSNMELYYRGNVINGGTSPNYSYSLHAMRLDGLTAPCANPAIAIIEKTYNYSRGVATTDLASASTETAATTLATQAGTTRFNPLELAATPNPANTSLHLELSGEQVKMAGAQLSDIYGHVVLKTELTRKGANAFTAELSVQHLAEGVYLLTVTDNVGNAKTSKVLIKH